MNADDLVRALTQTIFLLIFVIVVIQAVRRPLRANLDIALFFGAAAILVAQQIIVTALQLSSSAAMTIVAVILAVGLPYFLTRLLDDFAGVPAPIMRAAELALAFSVVAFLVVGQPLPLWLTLFISFYFLGLTLYSAVGFVRAARTSSGVTRRRMHAVAAGSLALGLVLVPGLLQLLRPELQALGNSVSRVLGLASGVAYFIGFAPPTWLRRSWQEPELRAFLGRAAALPRLPNTSSIVAELESGAATALGAARASIALWDPDAQLLRFRRDGEDLTMTPERGVAGQTFLAQRPILVTDAMRARPENRDIYRRRTVRAVLAAPITAGDKRLGTLAVYAPREPIFAEDDLELVRLLADQAAVILESRALIDDAARVRGREEAARLKDDFISAAAHDLKTPLTTLVAQAQLLQRRATVAPTAPADVNGIERLVGESRRMSELVSELLEALRAGRGALVGAREPVDLVDIARDACELRAVEPHRCTLEAEEPVVGEYDAMRIRQLVDNLMDNAIKYSPGGGEVRMKVWSADGEARLSVTDSGIGIPASDLPHIFERYHRGTNVDDRRFAGLGLGLFICRGIVEQHGGRIWAASAPEAGSTFHVALPLTPSAAHA